MTLRELSKYYRLHNRLEKNLDMIASLTAAAYPGAQSLAGTPHAGGVSDKVGNLAVEITDLKQQNLILEEHSQNGGGAGKPGGRAAGKTESGENGGKRQWGLTGF